MNIASPPAAKRSRKSADELMFREGMDAVKDDRELEALATAEMQETRESIHVAAVNEERLRYLPLCYLLSTKGGAVSFHVWLLLFTKC